MEIAKFNPTVAEIKAAVLEVEGLTISGVDDEAGYEAVKVGKKRLAEMRIKIGKFGKEQREEAIKWQKEVIRQENELLDMIAPTELKLKAEMDRIDQEKKRKEREILLPIRRKLIDELGTGMFTDDFLLAMDEKAFSEFYTKEKTDFMEMKERMEKDKEREAKHAEEVEAAKKEAAENARKEAEEKAEKDKQAAAEKAEKDKQDAIDKIKRDQEEKERKEQTAREQAIKDEEKRVENERKEQERTEKNKKYTKWLEENGVTEKEKPNFIIHSTIDGRKTKFSLFKKIDEITI